MTPLQSWVAMLLLFALVGLLVWIIATANAKLDRWLPTKHASGRALFGHRRARPTAGYGKTRDGFPTPVKDQIYDYTVHGL